ncbi:unnamed protein product [Haemonchus placei]|uniref:Protein asunder n=1 Tax=Haemonchus placei TaxID=6290 RepID=A0A0N4W767_HAEPC|nr:unnamed protein product [Haemonchus placei]
MGLGLDHKVLVVLDHGPRFAKKAGNPLSITLKESSVNRTVGKCDKSLWTWCVEATLELHRTVSDLFSEERDPSSARLMRLVLADFVGRVLQPRWGTQLVTQQELLASLSAIGLPSTNDEGESLALSGVTLAIEALSQLSEAQMKGEKSEASSENVTGSLMVFSGNATYPTTRLVWATPVPKGRWNMHVAKSEGLLGNVGAKLIAHTLIAHGGHIYIHANDLGPHKLLDAQDVREKMKLKRTANARISDFISLMKESTLRMSNDVDKKVALPATNVLCAQPRRHLLRVTRYWPLRFDRTFIYNIPKRFDAFFTIMRQPQLSTVDVDKCKQVIHQLVALKDSKERLLDGYVATRLLTDSNSRDEQLQVCFAEIARHLANYANHSEKHNEVFHFFVQSAGIERNVKIPSSDVLVTDRIHCKRQESSCTNSAMPSVSVTSSTASDMRSSNRSDSPLPKKPRKSCYLWKPNETLNLFDYLMEKEERQHRSQWVDFVGRVKAGNRPANLYPNLESAAVSTKQD